jgi:hypothetical protein
MPGIIDILLKDKLLDGIWKLPLTSEVSGCIITTPLIIIVFFTSEHFRLLKGVQISC